MSQIRLRATYMGPHTAPCSHSELPVEFLLMPADAAGQNDLVLSTDLSSSGRRSTAPLMGWYAVVYARRVGIA
jgi:hypothetical protein